MLEVFSLILGTKCPFQCTEFDLDQSLICKNGISCFGLFLWIILCTLYGWIMSNRRSLVLQGVRREVGKHAKTINIETSPAPNRTNAIVLATHPPKG